MIKELIARVIVDKIKLAKLEKNMTKSSKQMNKEKKKEKREIKFK